MKRSVAMMACVLSGALMIGSYSPVLAKTEGKQFLQNCRAGNYEDAKTDKLHQKMIKQTTPQR